MSDNEILELLNNAAYFCNEELKEKSNTELYASWGNIYSYMAKYKEDLSLFDKAIYYLEKAYKKDSKSDIVMYFYGEHYRNKGEYLKAYDLYNEALKHNSGYVLDLIYSSISYCCSYLSEKYYMDGQSLRLEDNYINIDSFNDQENDNNEEIKADKDEDNPEPFVLTTIYYRNNKKALFDPCRKILIPDNPEERVRQDLVKYLINKMQVPKGCISTEFSLNHINKSSLQRADIIVWADKDMQIPLLVIEVKSPDVALTDTVLEQVLEYHRIVKCDYVGICNGNEFIIYHIQKDGNMYPLSSYFTHNELLEQKNLEYDYSSNEIFKKSYRELTTKKYIEMLKEDGVIGVDTPEKLHSFIVALDNFVLTEEVRSQMPIEYNGLTVKEDISYNYLSYGNAAGGKFLNFYRGFIINDLDTVLLTVPCS